MYQVMALDWLVDIQRIQEWNFEASQPHRHYNGDLEVGLGVLELPVQFFAIVLGAEQVVEIHWAAPIPFGADTFWGNPCLNNLRSSYFLSDRNQLPIHLLYYYYNSVLP